MARMSLDCGNTTLLSCIKVNMLGLGSRVPKPIDASQIDKHSNGQQIAIRVGTLELMQTSCDVAK
eukprot:6121525-Prorocentrum_lima.AAC.1